VSITSLPQRKDFLRLRAGKRYKSSLFTVQAATTPRALETDSCRVGYTVTTKTGIAVERNRIKRRLRAATAEIFSDIAEPGYDYAIIARRACLEANFQAITSELKQALDHLHANRAKGGKT